MYVARDKKTGHHMHGKPHEKESHLRFSVGLLGGMVVNLIYIVFVADDHSRRFSRYVCTTDPIIFLY